MVINTQTAPSTGTKDVTAKARLWTGRLTWILAVPFLFMDAGLHLANPAPVVEASQKLGFPNGVIQPIGLVELICLAIYLIPRTATLGAVLLTRYLGGAVATQVRIGGQWWFAVFIGTLVWASLYCRDARVRNLFS